VVEYNLSITYKLIIILYIQRVSEISTLILTSDSSRQEQQNFYVSFFRNMYYDILVFSLGKGLILME
jgi:hypothetical protein